MIVINLAIGGISTDACIGKPSEQLSLLVM